MNLMICHNALRGTCKSEYCPHRALHKEVNTLTTFYNCDHDGVSSGGCPPCKHLKDLPKKTQMELLIKDF